MGTRTLPAPAATDRLRVASVRTRRPDRPRTTMRTDAFSEIRKCMRALRAFAARAAVKRRGVMLRPVMVGATRSAATGSVADATAPAGAGSAGAEFAPPAADP